MGYKYIGVRLLLLLLLPNPLLAQFTYTMDQTVPVEISGMELTNPWAGGLNSPQVNTMDLNADGAADLVIFDKTTVQIRTFLWLNNRYQYAPEYETYFPTTLSTFVALRDFNCDGKKDIFTFGQIGIFVFEQITETGKPFAWKKVSFMNADTGLSSEVLLTKGFATVNLLPGSNDIPDFTDMDGDGDLDVLNMRFVSPSTAEYHENTSKSHCNLDSLVRRTSNWGGFLECSCGKIAFQGQTCADIGGRTNHTGGKAMLSLDTDGDGDKDLLFTEESCTNIYRMENLGTTAIPVMNNLSIFPLSDPVGIANYPAPYLEDVDKDGINDLLFSPTLSARDDTFNDFASSLWFYKNTGTNSLPVFELQQFNFLQDQMIEIGDLSAPAFADIDLDGDLDLFAGTFINPKNFRGSIAFYQNTGTSQSPSYSWVTDDFANLSFTSLYYMRPQFVDVDRNGSLDLTFTGTAGGLTRLFYILSLGSAAASFDGQNLLSMDVPLGQEESATLVDVDLDGNLDVLVGKANGSLYYYRNNGSGGTYMFSLANDAYLGLGVSTSRRNVTTAIADLDGDGRDDLVAGDYAGTLSVFNDFRSAGSSPVPEKNLVRDPFTSLYTARNFGGSSRPAIGNIYGVNRPVIVVGNRQGGLHLLKNDNTQPLSDVPSISLSPNPVGAGGALTILADRSVTIEIHTVLGARLGQSQVIPGNQPVNFPIQGIAAGLYIARFTSGEQSVGIRFVVR